jgi:hypothetical protein
VKDKRRNFTQKATETQRGQRRVGSGGGRARMDDQTRDEDEYGQQYTREEVEEKIARGLAQLERGEGVDARSSLNS